ncbi:Os10g0423501, partial [Oryza sativa Japonica Group]
SLSHSSATASCPGRGERAAPRRLPAEAARERGGFSTFSASSSHSADVALVSSRAPANASAFSAEPATRTRGGTRRWGAGRSRRSRRAPHMVQST